MIAEKVIGDQHVLGWVTAADRMRVKGVGWEYAQLLLAVGVKTAKELKYRNPQKLVDKMVGRPIPSASWFGCCLRSPWSVAGSTAPRNFPPSFAIEIGEARGARFRREVADDTRKTNVQGRTG